MDILQNARDSIDNIDKQMADLFQQRMEAVKAVALYKKSAGINVLDSSREQAVIDKNASHIKNDSYKAYYEDFIKHTMEISKSYQRRLICKNTVGYQGTEGAFSHIAVLKLFDGSQSKAYPTFESVFKGVEQGEIEFGVLPFENSYTGEIGEVFDLLYKYDCFITKMYDLKIEHNLLGIKGSKIGDIKQVYSHHQGLSQCKRFLESYGLEQIDYPNTALAAKHVAECNDNAIAAVASKETADLYGLCVLAENINTSKENTTRFIVISREENTVGNRFSLLFTVENQVGQLAKIMQVICEFGFNMENIKSKSLHNMPWQYYFYVELEGDSGSDKAKAMLSVLKENCRGLKVAGVYTK